jgi:ubiquitin C-terminal hydrolase
MHTTNPDTDFRWNTQNDAPEVLEVLIEAVTSECAAAKDLFGVVERQSQTCSVCSHVSSRAFPPQNLLYVNVKESVAEMIESCSVDQAVVRECVQCGEKQMTTTRTDLAVAPPILILQIRDRFLPSPLNDGSIVLNNLAIKHLSPLNARIRTGICVEISVRYNVLAIIHHEGIRNNRGHYFAPIKKQDSWFRCSDRAITPSVLSTLGADTAYVILCKKVQ